MNDKNKKIIDKDRKSYIKDKKIIDKWKSRLKKITEKINLK